MPYRFVSPTLAPIAVLVAVPRRLAQTESWARITRRRGSDSVITAENRR